MTRIVTRAGRIGSVRIEPWGEEDLPILEKALGDPTMTTHIGGPESPEKTAERQARYERPDSRQYKIVDQTTGGGVVGWVGLHAAGGVRIRVPEGQPHAVQRLAS